jgi:hypothetical protein
MLFPFGPARLELADLLMCARASAVTLAYSQRAFRSEGGTTRSDLSVIGYPDEETAQDVWEELVKLERDYLVDPEDAAIIRADHQGELHITTPAHHAVAWGRYRPGSSQRPQSRRRARRPDRRARTASRDPTRTSDVAPHRKQQSHNEANKRAREVDR